MAGWWLAVSIPDHMGLSTGLLECPYNMASEQAIQETKVESVLLFIIWL